MKKPNICIDAGKCKECLACQLICSFTYTGSFNPQKSFIIINPPEIDFIEECKKGCSLCTKYCPHGAITRVKREG